LVVHGGRVYVTGNFGTIGGAARNRLAALDATTGVVTPWDPNLTQGGDVNPIEGLALEARNGTIYLGGNFAAVGNYGVRGLAAIADPALVGVPAPGGPGRPALQLDAVPSLMRDRTHLTFALPRAAEVSLGLFDPAGRRVRQLLSAVRLPAGPHE